MNSSRPRVQHAECQFCSVNSTIECWSKCSVRTCGEREKDRMTTADQRPQSFPIPGIGSESSLEVGSLTPSLMSPAHCGVDKGRSPYMMLRLYSSLTEAGTDDSSDNGTPLKESTLPFFLESPQEKDKLDQMLSMLNDDEDFDPIREFPNRGAQSWDDMALQRKKRTSKFLRRRSTSWCGATWPSIPESTEEDVLTSTQRPTSPPDNGGEATTSNVVTLYECLKDRPPSPHHHSPTHSTGDVHSHPLSPTQAGNSQQSKNAAIFDLLRDSSGSENDAPNYRGAVPWRVRTQSVHSENSNSDHLQGLVHEMDTEELLVTLGFCDFESPQLIPDRLIPDHIAHARPTFLAQSTICGYVPPSSLHDSAVQRRSSSEEPEEIEQDIPLGGTAETFSALPSRVSPKPVTTVPIPISSLPDTPYYPYYPLGLPLETVVEETASQLSPSGSPRVSPRHSIDNDMGPSLDGKQVGGGNLLSVPQPRKGSLPLQGQPQAPPSNRDGYKISIESLKSYPSVDTIYFSITSYDDDEEGTGVHNQPLSPRARKKATAVAPDSKLLHWLQCQPSTEELNEGEQPWPFSERSPKSNSTESVVHKATPSLLQVAMPQELRISQSSISECSASGSYYSFQQDTTDESSEKQNDESSSYDDAVERQSDNTPYFYKMHRISQCSTIRRGSNTTSTCHKESCASTIVVPTPGHTSFSTHRESPELEAPPPHHQTLDLDKQTFNLAKQQNLSLDQVNPSPDELYLLCKEEKSSESDVASNSDVAMVTDDLCPDNDLPSSPVVGVLDLEGSSLPVTVIPNGNHVADGRHGDKVTCSYTSIELPPLPVPPLSPRQPTSSEQKKESSTGQDKLLQKPSSVDKGNLTINGIELEALSQEDSSSVLKEKVLHLHNMLDQKNRDIDMLTQSHLLEVAEMKKQIDTLRNSMKANKGLMDTKMAAVVEERNSLNTQFRELQRQQKAELNKKELAVKKENDEELQVTKDRLNHEKEIDLAKLKEKHRREVNELKRQLSEKEGEVSQLKVFSKEREEASSALADELKTVRRDAREKEAKLKETLQEEVRRTEKQLLREKTLAVAKVQESIQFQRQKDLLELKEKLLEDKQLALAETKKKFSTALEDLTRKNQVCEEDLRSVTSQLEEARQHLSTMKEEMVKTAKKELKAALLKEKFSAQRDLKDSLQKERDSHQSEVDQLRKKFEDRMNAEQEKNGQLKVQLAELKASLDSERQLTHTLRNEKQSALAKAKDSFQQKLQAELSALRQRLDCEHKLELDRAAEKVKRIEAEMQKKRQDEQFHQQKERDFLRRMEEGERGLLADINNECQKVALLLGRKQCRPSSAKESMLPSNKSSALMMLRKLVEDLHGFIPELRSQVDKERQMVTKLQKEKDTKLRQVKLEAQIEKSEALKSQEDRLMKEYQLTKTGSTNPSKDVPKTVSIGLQTSDELLSKPMKLAVKMEEQRHLRTKAILNERTSECVALQTKLKQLTKEHLQLQQTISSSLSHKK